MRRDEREHCQSARRGYRGARGGGGDRGGCAREHEWLSCREHRLTAVDCCQRPCARAPRCTERVGESRSHFCGDGCFLAPHGCKRWSRARFLWRVPRSPLCFSCAHRRVGVARAMVREAKREAATAPTAICPGVVGGRRYYEEGSDGAQVAFFSRSPRASAPSLTAGGGSCVSRLGVWTSGAPTGPFRCLGLFVR